MRCRIRCLTLRRSAMTDTLTCGQVLYYYTYRRMTSQPDPSLPAHHTSTNEDYRRSGWSHGHMAPAGNYKHLQSSMDDTFFLTNIVPQDFSNNSGYWNRLEIYCRKLTRHYDEVSIISGPLFLPERRVAAEGGKERKYVTYEVIGENDVAVPTHLYKVVLAEKVGQQPAMGAFIVPNRPLGNEKLREFQVPLEQLERYVGATFHSDLDRSKAQDLCQRESCQLISREKMELWFYDKKIKTAKSLEEVERLCQEAEKKGADDTLRETCKNKKLQFQQNPPRKD